MVVEGHQWRSNGTAISGATKTTYKIPATLAGKKVTITVTGSKTGYTTTSKTSASTAAVAKGSLTTAAPKITGAAKVGNTLKASAGTWGPSPVTLKYQWRSNGTAISGATKTTYKIPATLAGKKVTITVTGSKTGYTTTSKTSARTSAVKK